MDTKHTPGPWESWITGGNFGVTGMAASIAYCAMEGIKSFAGNDASLAIRIAASNKTAPAIVFGNTREEAEANARLVAAAPELLEVARSAAAIGFHGMPEGQGPCKCSRCEMVTEARAAIAKATGASHG